MQKPQRATAPALNTQHHTLKAKRQRLNGKPVMEVLQGAPRVAAEGVRRRHMAASGQRLLVGVLMRGRGRGRCRRGGRGGGVVRGAGPVDEEEIEVACFEARQCGMAGLDGRGVAVLARRQLRCHKHLRNVQGWYVRAKNKDVHTRFIRARKRTPTLSLVCFGHCTQNKQGAMYMSLFARRYVGRLSLHAATDLGAGEP